MSTQHTMAPATDVSWFNLARHDEEPAEPAPETPEEPEPAEPSNAPADLDEPDGPEEPEAEPEGADKLGEAGKKALDRMKAERAAAKKEATEAKRQLAALAKKVQEFEDRDKSELEKVAAKAERLAEQATKATARAVQAEVKSLAVGQFADAGDAVDVLMRDPSKYVDADGEIDTDAIGSDLTDLLERKPHWALPEPVPAAALEARQKPKPRPDPGQGSRGTPPPKDFLDASDDEVAAELSKYGYRKRF